MRCLTVPASRCPARGWSEGCGRELQGGARGRQWPPAQHPLPDSSHMLLGGIPAPSKLPRCRTMLLSRGGERTSGQGAMGRARNSWRCPAASCSLAHSCRASSWPGTIANSSWRAGGGGRRPEGAAGGWAAWGRGVPATKQPPLAASTEPPCTRKNMAEMHDTAPKCSSDYLRSCPARRPAAAAVPHLVATEGLPAVSRAGTSGGGVQCTSRETQPAVGASGQGVDRGADRAGNRGSHRSGQRVNGSPGTMHPCVHGLRMPLTELWPGSLQGIRRTGGGTLASGCAS